MFDQGYRQALFTIHKCVQQVTRPFEDEFEDAFHYQAIIQNDRQDLDVQKPTFQYELLQPTMYQC